MAEPNPAAPPSPGFWSSSWQRLRHHRLAMVGLLLLAFVSLACIGGPWLSPYGYEEQQLELGPTSTSAAHWLGTDVLGRDQLTRLLYGGRVSLLVGLCATAVSLAIGLTYGLIAGYRGGRVDAVMMRVVDALYALPFSVLAIVLMVVFGRNFLLLFVAIGLVEWLTMARIVRGQVLSLREQAFVKAGRVLGYSPARIMSRHILPNIMGPVVVYTTLTVPQVILLESFLSFLGLGVQPPTSSWGLLIRNGAEVMESYPWLLLWPGLALSITLFALNFVGDGLRDALDPRFIARSGSKP
ncbi:MAG: ABC transporter permease [Lentisphaerae bacterium]|nr:ABC transporter permease [Lentisphaerota bacterium]